MLDEPSLGLAPAVIEQVYALLRSVREQGVTILLWSRMPSGCLVFPTWSTS